MRRACFYQDVGSRFMQDFLEDPQVEGILLYRDSQPSCPKVECRIVVHAVKVIESSLPIHGLQNGSSPTDSDAGYRQDQQAEAGFVGGRRGMQRRQKSRYPKVRDVVISSQNEDSSQQDSDSNKRQEGGPRETPREGFATAGPAPQKN